MKKIVSLLTVLVCVLCLAGAVFAGGAQDSKAGAADGKNNWKNL